MNETKVSVPPHKGGLATGVTPDPVKTSPSIKGFGGSVKNMAEGNDTITRGSPKGSVPGFSGSGTKGGKV